MLSCHPVPIYDSLGENAVEYIVNHAGVELIYLDIAKLPAYVKVRPSRFAAASRRSPL